MIGRGFIQKLYDAASIQRWNDHARPFEIVELDKQAHKMVIAWVIGKFEESDKNASIDWLGIIEGGIFEFLHRVILTDIKPTVFHKMMEEKGEELNSWVLGQIQDDIKAIRGEFRNRFETYFFSPDYLYTEKRVLQAAHYLATDWEFKIIYQLNPFIYGIEKTKEEIENRLEDFYDFVGVQKISLGKKSFGFIDLCGQLRFQKRWSGIPRIPQTSVLGHMLIVAILVYLCSIEINVCEKGRYNNFFAGLFHDLSEVLTRDIISPIKHSVHGLEGIIREYERAQVDEKLLPLLPHAWHREINYFIREEFENKIIRDGEITSGISIEDILGVYNKDAYGPINGELIRACDELAAFIEAKLSLLYGIKSPHLLNAVEEFSTRFKGKRIGDIDFGTIIEECDTP